jgi:hypothetical protein
MELKIMTTKYKYISVGIFLAAFALVLVLMFGKVIPAFSARLASTPTPPPGDVIPLQPISGLTSLNATVNISVNGLINGQRAQGSLQAVLTTNDQGKSQATISGTLLGQLATQVGGSLVGLFTPSSVDVFKVPKGTYVVVNSIFPVCVKPADPKATKALDDMGPQAMMSMLTSSDVARGKYIGEETLNGVKVKHYMIDGDTFLTAAQNSSDPKLKAFGDALWTAEDADLYVDSKGGYPVAFRGSYSGEYEPLKFQGEFTVDIQLTGINTNTAVNLPASCNKPISQ